jgi:hypothetical protein
MSWALLKGRKPGALSFIKLSALAPAASSFAFYFALALAYAEKMLWGRCHSEALLKGRKPGALSFIKTSQPWRP